MAVRFLQTEDGPVKIQLDEETYNKLPEEEKTGLEMAEEEGYLTTAKSQLGDSKGTVPKKMEVAVTGKAFDSELAKELLTKRTAEAKGNLDDYADLDDYEKGKKKDSGFKSFVKSVGSAFQNIADGAEKKLETVYDDREKRAMFLSGLNTIIDASSYTPITKAKSPFGTIAGGQKKGFLESEAIASKRKKSEVDLIKAQAGLMKAQKGEPPRFRDDISEAILKEYPNFQTRYRDLKKQYGALDQRYIELYKLAQKGFEAPTGLVSEFLTPFEKVFSELGLSEKYENLKKNVSGLEKGQDLSAADKVAFKDLFSAATKSAIVSQVKDLYPASDKDIQVLLSTIGDVGTNPQALRKLVAAQKAMMEINEKVPEFAKTEAFINKDIEFESVANEKAAQALANELKDKVSSESLVELFGTAEDANPFRIINAYYYQQLAPDFKEGPTDYFSTYKKSQVDKEMQIQDIITNEITQDLLNKK